MPNDDYSQSHDRFQDYLKQIHSPPTSTESSTSKFDVLPAGFVVAERYQIISFIGEGGMSMVYKARHIQTNRIVALKLLQKYLVADKVQIERFQQEAEAARRLNHPHIIKVFEGGYDENVKCFIAMDYLEGRSLADAIKEEGPLALRRAIKIFAQACDAFQHAHDLGVVHRDIKPSNLMLTRSHKELDFVEILDFGTAKLLPSEGVEQQYLTREGEVFGSPLYMSPEQCMALNLDARSDIYSMGCLIYEAMTGNPPHVGGNVYETFHKQTYDAAKPLTEERPRPWLEMSQLDAIVLKCMAKKPRDRYASMNELKADLLEVAATAGQRRNFIAKLQDRQVLAKRRKKAQAQRGGPPAGVIVAVVVLTLSITGLLAFHLWQTTHLSGPLEQQLLTLNTRGQRALNEGNYDEARKSFDQALHLAQTKNDPLTVQSELLQLLDLARAQLKEEESTKISAQLEALRQQYVKDTQDGIKELKTHVALAVEAAPAPAAESGSGSVTTSGSDDDKPDKRDEKSDRNKSNKDKAADLARLYGELNSRAESDIRMGLYDRAREDLLPIIDVKQSLKNPLAGPSIVSRTLHNLALVEMATSNYKGAFSLMREAVRLRLEVHSPDIVASADKLVQLSDKINAYAGTKELLDGAITSGALSDQQPSLQYLLARLLFNEHKYKEDRSDEYGDVEKNIAAASNAVEAGQKTNTVLGASLQSLAGDIARSKQDFGSAKAFYTKSVNALEDKADDVESILAKTLLGLAISLSDNTPSEGAKAMPLYMRTFAMDMRLPAKEEEMNQALSRIKWSKMQEGKPLQMADIFNFKLNIDSKEMNKPGSAQDNIYLGKFYAQQGNQEQAITHMEKALTMRESYFGGESWETCEILSLLGRTYTDAGKMKIAEDLLSRAKNLIAEQDKKDNSSLRKHRDLIQDVFKNYCELMNKTDRGDQAKAAQDQLNNLLQ